MLRPAILRLTGSLPKRTSESCDESTFSMLRVPFTLLDSSGRH
jgi:hypothetical protein